MSPIESLALSVAELQATVEDLDRRLRIAERRVSWGALSYTVVADKIGIDVRELRRWVALGKFPQPVRRGHRNVRFRAADVQAYIDGDWQP